jgi:phosphoglycerate-specific signal transduction histidine kinase
VDSYPPPGLLSIWIHIQNIPKRPAALLAGLTWIQELLRQFPNHTGSNPLPLPIPVDNEGVIKDVHRIINAQTPTYNLISPNFDILQAIRTKLNELLTIPTDIAHVKGHQDRTKSWDELDRRAKINVLADRQADAIYKKPHGGLDCSHPGSLVLVLLLYYFMVNNKLPKASLRTFGMQLTHQS